MHVAQNWRLNPQRYCLQPEVFHDGQEPPTSLRGVERLSGSTEHLHPEKRSIGALLLISDGQDNVWLMRDTSKPENVGDFYTGTYNARSKRWNTIAGGQHGSETVWGTITAEYLEELYKEAPEWQQNYLRNIFSGISNSKLSPHFLIVNQEQRKGEHVLKINRIAVSIWETTAIKDSPLHQELSTKGVWVPTYKVAGCLGHFYECPNGVPTYKEKYNRFRPQMIVAAALKCGYLNKDDIKALNVRTIELGAEMAEEYQIPVEQGVVADTGELFPTVTYDTRAYLGVNA